MTLRDAQSNINSFFVRSETWFQDDDGGDADVLHSSIRHTWGIDQSNFDWFVTVSRSVLVVVTAGQSFRVVSERFNSTFGQGDNFDIVGGCDRRASAWRINFCSPILLGSSSCSPSLVP